MGKKPTIAAMPVIQIYASEELPKGTYRPIDDHRIVVSLDIYESITHHELFKKFKKFKTNYKIQPPV